MTAPIERHASCACGRLRLTCVGEPLRVSICHCLECQRRTGSVFAVQAQFASGCVTAEGDAGQWTRAGDEGGATFRFCGSCGATVWWQPVDDPDRVYVAVGAFADPAFPPPAVSVYEARRHPWTRAPEALPLARYD